MDKLLIENGWQEFYSYWMKSEWIEQGLSYEEMAVEKETAYKLLITNNK